MTILESKTITLPQSDSLVQQYLSDLRNHQQIMPEQVVDFEATEDTCNYVIKGTGNLSLKRVESSNANEIKLIPNGKVPFQFDLIWVITPDNEGCKVQAILTADLNFMMRSIAAKPLNNFIDMQVDGLLKHFLSK